MARGDAVIWVGSLTSAGKAYYQPAVGVEVMILGVNIQNTTSTATANYGHGVYDGSLYVYNAYSSLGPGTAVFYTNRFMITNNIYLFFDFGGPGKYGLNGIQTKGSMLKVGDKILTGNELKAYREKWLKKRIEELKATTETVEYVDSSGVMKTKTIKLIRIVEDRDDLGDLRGILYELG